MITLVKVYHTAHHESIVRFRHDKDTLSEMEIVYADRDAKTGEITVDTKITDHATGTIIERRHTFNGPMFGLYIESR